MPELRPILSQRPPLILRLGLDSQITFHCGQDLDCFRQFCHNVSIVLTPYDVLRMKRTLQMGSSAFLNKFTVAMNSREKSFPVVVLLMDTDTLKCPFLSAQGCSIYADRPWACRMYPLGLAEPGRPAPDQRGFYFLIRENICLGHEKGNSCSVRSWLASQDIKEYEMMEASFKGLMLNEFWEKGKGLTPEKVEMYFMACYDLDRFRRLVFETKFLRRFEVEETRVSAIRRDDEELLEPAMEWLRFMLFGDQKLRLRKAASAGSNAHRHRAAKSAGS
jgi:Fe-S-cluster containining protein